MKILRIAFLAGAFLLASPAFADTRLQALFSLTSAIDSFQDIDFTDKGEDLNSETGSGILFDWTMPTPDSILSGGLSNHAVAIDYYELREEEDGLVYAAENFFIGYRYHFLSRFYAGVSVGLVSELEVGESQASATPLAYTLGYSYKFPFGFTLGGHVFRTLSEDYEIDSGGEIEDVTLSLIGLTLGFRF